MQRVARVFNKLWPTKNIPTSAHIPVSYKSTQSIPAVDNIQQQVPRATVNILGKDYPADENVNITPTIAGLVGRNLHLLPQHPINIIKQRVVNHFNKTYTTRTGNALCPHFDDMLPVVTTEQNFDSLLIPKDHVSRSKKDNYYINKSTMLRAHTSAHQRDFIRMGLDKFLMSGDVYRRDEIDSCHYPAFHQMDGVWLYTEDEFKNCTSESLALLEKKGSASYVETADKQAMHTMDAVKVMEVHLKKAVVLLMKEIFGDDVECRWVPAFFPFTHPSYELEVKFKGEWLEILGSGVVRQEILENAGASDKAGWAFGFGLDRLAMLLFNIPDIRLFWSKDKRFVDQFASVDMDRSSNVEFTPFSKYPASYKDIAFWLPPPNTDKTDNFSENDFCDLVRSVCDDLVERVELVDEFVHPSTGRTSRCYRITYRSMDRTLTNDEVNDTQEKIRQSCSREMGVELR